MTDDGIMEPEYHMHSYLFNHSYRELRFQMAACSYTSLGGQESHLLGGGGMRPWINMLSRYFISLQKFIIAGFSSGQVSRQNLRLPDMPPVHSN